MITKFFKMIRKINNKALLLLKMIVAVNRI